MMKKEKGFALVEVLVCLAILGFIGVAFLGGLGTASRGLITADEQETAKNLAESQMENVKNQDYALSYSPATVPPEYTDYSVAIDSSDITERDGNIQKIMITISHNNKEVLKLEGFKTN